MLSKPEASIKLISEALDAGIVADYVLMDTWFTTEPMIQSILELGLDVIGMVKQLKQRYYFNGKAYTLPELQKFVNCQLPDFLTLKTEFHLPLQVRQK